MNKLTSNMPSQLSEISFNSDDIVNVKIGWDFRFNPLEFHPIIHLFYENGNRIDLVSLNKKSTQGVKIVNYVGTSFDVEFNMKKLPSYVSSIYISLGSVDEKIELSLLKDLYLQIQGKSSSEIWSKNIIDNSGYSMSVFVLDKIKIFEDKMNKTKWVFDFPFTTLPSNLIRLESVITKTDLFYLPEVQSTLYQKIEYRLITLISIITEWITKFLI